MDREYWEVRGNMKYRIKQWAVVLFGIIMVAMFAGCGGNTDTSQKSSSQRTKEEVEKNGGSKLLIAYFTLADNLEDASKLDATSQASLNPRNKELVGNTEYLAENIQSALGGDLLSVVVEKPYPNDYDTVVDMASEEQEENTRPALFTHVDNIEQYDTIFVGFPIWWYKMPQAMVTFLEENDLAGKTIIPFATHGGYGVGSSVEEIKELCPDSNVIENIFEAERENVSDRQQDIDIWLEEIGMRK